MWNIVSYHCAINPNERMTEINLTLSQRQARTAESRGVTRSLVPRRDKNRLFSVLYDN